MPALQSRPYLPGHAASAWGNGAFCRSSTMLFSQDYAVAREHLRDAIFIDGQHQRPLYGINAEAIVSGGDNNRTATHDVLVDCVSLQFRHVVRRNQNQHVKVAGDFCRRQASGCAIHMIRASCLPISHTAASSASDARTDRYLDPGGVHKPTTFKYPEDERFSAASIALRISAWLRSPVGKITWKLSPVSTTRCKKNVSTAKKLVATGWI